MSVILQVLDFFYMLIPLVCCNIPIWKVTHPCKFVFVFLILSLADELSLCYLPNLMTWD